MDALNALTAALTAALAAGPAPNGRKEAPIESGAEGGDGSTVPPDQPVVTDAQGVLRFRPNAIVCDLLDLAQRHGLADMNSIAAGEYGQQDRIQFAQLLGYSVDGLADLPYAATRLARAAVLPNNWDAWVAEQRRRPDHDSAGREPLLDAADAVVRRLVPELGWPLPPTGFLLSGDFLLAWVSPAGRHELEITPASAPTLARLARLGR